jgi:hypothetical protein
MIYWQRYSSRKLGEVVVYLGLLARFGVQFLVYWFFDVQSAGGV